MKILIISSNLIGDNILSTCVVEYFAKKNPKACFTFLIGPSAGQIYEHFPLTKKIILIKKRILKLHWFEMYAKTWNNKWDIVIDLRSSLISYLLFSRKKLIFKKDKKLNHLDQLKNFFELNNSILNIYTSKNEQDIVDKHIDRNFRYVCIFPGGNWSPKIWPSTEYNKFLHLLNKNYKNLKFIIIGSDKEKKLYLKNVTKGLDKKQIIDLMGISLTQTYAYMKKTNLFVGNDSGLMHLAFAANLPSIALFGPTNDKIYGHKDEISFIIRTELSYEKFNKKTIDPNVSFMNSIQPKKILKLILQKKLL